MAWRRTKLVVAFDASSVSAATFEAGLGAARFGRLAAAPLEPGVLVPSPVDANVTRPEAVTEAVGRAAALLDARGARAILLLPDGLARLMLLESPSGVPPAGYARFRLSPGLPYPAAEAVVDALPLGRRRLLAAAVRRSVVAGYEAAASAAGLEPESVDLVPLRAVAALARSSAGGASVGVILGDAAFSLAAFQAGELQVFRSRRRDPGPGEPARIADEIVRTAALAGDGVAPRVRIVGAGALSLVRELSGSGCRAEPGWRAEDGRLPHDAAEVAWLGMALR